MLELMRMTAEANSGEYIDPAILKQGKSMKYSLKLINAFNAILGLTFLITGLVLVYKREEGLIFIGRDTYKLLSTSMTFNGLILSIFSLFGFFGIRRRLMLIIHAFMGMLILLLMIIVASKIPSNQKMLDGTQTQMFLAMRSYKNSSTTKYVLDHIQFKMHCCGVLSYRDWCENETKANSGNCELPPSCMFCNMPCHRTSFKLNQVSYHVAGCLAPVNGYLACAINFHKSLNFLMISLVGLSSLLSFLMFLRVPKPTAKKSYD